MRNYATDEQKAIQAMTDALYSALNLEHAAMLGAEDGSLQGLDVPYHFKRIREAIKAAESLGFTFE